MSECKEDWGRSMICPVLRRVTNTEWACLLHQWMYEIREEKFPATCPYAPILKLLAEAKEVKGPNDKSAMRYKTIRGDTMEEWESYTFWTRR